MLFTVKNVLAIEILPHRINILEGVRSARQIKINNFLQIDNKGRSAEERGKNIAAALKARGIKSKGVYLAFYSPETVNHYSLIPNLSKKELHQVIKRQAAKIKEALFALTAGEDRPTGKKNSEVCFDYQLLGEVSQKKIKKKCLLLVAAPQRLIEEQIKTLEGADLTPLLITSTPLATINALALHSPLTEKEEDNTAFLHILPDRGLLTLLNQGMWRFFREIPLFSPTGDNEESESLTYPPQAGPEKRKAAQEREFDYEQLVIEINRSFLYFNQIERGKLINRLVISSLPELPEEALKTFAAGLHIPVHIFNPGEKVSLNGPPSLPLGSLAAPLGLLSEGPGHMAINLLPIHIRERKKDLAGGLIITLVIALYFAAAAIGYFALSWARDNYRAALASHSAGLKELEPAFEKTQKARRERQLFDYHRTILESFRRDSPLWRGVLFEFSKLHVPGLIFSSIDIKEEGEAWLFAAEGSISARDSKEAQNRLQRFMAAMHDSLSFTAPRIENLKITPAPAQGEDGKKKDGEAARISFLLECALYAPGRKDIRG